MTTIEHREIRGITLRIFIAIVVGACSVVLSVAGAYYGLKSDLSAIKDAQETTNQVNEVRIKVLETRVDRLERQQKKD